MRPHRHASVLILIWFLSPTSANATWTSDGNPACIAANAQDEAVSVADGSGGTIVVWRDTRTEAGGDIYAQRVSGNGASLWLSTGVAVCTAMGVQRMPAVAADGAGGVIIAWEDQRVDGAGDVYAQRLDAAGTAMWTADGEALVTGASANDSGDPVIQMVSDGVGGAILSFSDNRHADGSLDPSFGKVWAQRVNGSGSAQWGNGVPVGAAAFAHGNHLLVPDGCGGAIVVWQDGRVFGDWNISAQRLDASGNALWSSVGVCQAGGQQTQPAASADGAGGVIIAWSDSRVDGVGDVYAQRLDAAGTAMWTADGEALVTGASSNDGGDPVIQMVSDGVGGAILSFSDNRHADGSLDPNFGKVWAQRVNGSGSAAWGNGVPVGAAAFAHGNHALVPDGGGGAIVVWQDGRIFGDWNISAQHLDADGNETWATGGLTVCGESGGQQLRPTIVASGAGTIVVTWRDERNDAADVYAQRITNDGMVAQDLACDLLGQAGTPFAAAAQTQDQQVSVADGSGGTIVVWRDTRTEAGGDIYAQRVSGNGASLWLSTGVAVCTAMGVQRMPAVAADGAGGVIIAWEDQRVDGAGDVYAQRLDAAGTAMWTADGEALVTGASANDSGDPVIQMVSDGVGGAILSFSDNRHADGSLDPSFGKVWAQRVNGSGSAEWGNGVPVGAAAFAHGNHLLVPDGCGGAIVVWQDGRVFGDWNISAQRLDASGNALWSSVGVCQAGGQQTQPAASADGAGGVIIAWSDSRVDGVGDVYAQRLDAAGTAMWTADGEALVTGASSNDGGDPVIQMVSDGVGGAILSFSDNRHADGSLDPNFGKVWAQRVNGSGSAAWGNGVPVGAAAFAHGNHALVPDGGGGAIVVWQDGRIFGDWNISAQHLDADGDEVYTPGGIFICRAGGAQTMPVISPDGFGSGIVIWRDSRTDVSDLFVQRACRWGTVVDVEEDPGIDARRSIVQLRATSPTWGALHYDISLGESSKIGLEVYDARGRFVANLQDTELGPGNHSFTWARREVGSGIYFMQLTTARLRQSIKIVLLH